MAHTSVAVIEKGRLKLLDREHFRQGIARMPDGAVSITVDTVSDTRSDAANRYYFGVVIEAIYQACDRQHTKDEIHDEMCDRFLKYRILRVNFRTGEVEEREVTGRSSRLKVGKFYDFVEQVIAWAYDFFPGIDIQPADKEYRRHREQARVKALKAKTAA